MGPLLSSQLVYTDPKQKAGTAGLYLNALVRSFVAQLLDLPESEALTTTLKQGHEGDSNAYIVEIL